MRTHRTMALAATFSIAAAATMTSLPSEAFTAHADVTSSIAPETDDGPSAETILAALRGCESGGDYTSDNHDGFFGAYQFMIETWQALGYEGNPTEASPRTQDEAAVRLQARSGWDQWPACSESLGLTSLTLPELGPDPNAPKIAVVPLTTIAVVEPETSPPPGPPPHRTFSDLVAEFG